MGTMVMLGPSVGLVGWMVIVVDEMGFGFWGALPCAPAPVPPDPDPAPVPPAAAVAAAVVVVDRVVVDRVMVDMVMVVTGPAAAGCWSCVDAVGVVAAEEGRTEDEPKLVLVIMLGSGWEVG